MGYSREEMETTLVYIVEEDRWMAYSNYSTHIRKIKEFGEIISEEYEDDRVISVKGYLGSKNVAIRKPRQMSEQQKQKAAERLKKARESK